MLLDSGKQNMQVQGLQAPGEQGRHRGSTRFPAEDGNVSCVLLMLKHVIQTAAMFAGENNLPWILDRTCSKTADSCQCVIH